MPGNNVTTTRELCKDYGHTVEQIIIAPESAFSFYSKDSYYIHLFVIRGDLRISDLRQDKEVVLEMWDSWAHCGSQDWIIKNDSSEDESILLKIACQN